jgi:acetylornithine/LysW-gamma-L-lysine aminotransferase
VHHQVRSTRYAKHNISSRGLARPGCAARAGEGAQYSVSDIIALEDAHTSGAYPKRPVALVRGQGARVWDADGREYIDCIAGHGVAGLGHCHPAVTAAIAEQAGRLVTCSETLYNDQRAALMAELVGCVPGDLKRVFLCNSGAEAIEGSIKIARLFTGRTGVIATMRGFHGRTLGALSATWNEKYRRPFEPLVPGFSHVPFNDLPAMAEAITDQTAAVLVEVVQGEGGVRPGDAEYFQGLRRLCDERGALLILDEIQSGLGRTGRWFAFEHVDVMPDVLCLGKALGGGLPMGAILWRETLGMLPTGVHGTTFGGNPLVCATSRTVLRVMTEEDLPARAARLGEQFMARLRAIPSPLVREVRGWGLLVGVELRQRATPILQALLERGLLALPAGPTVLRFLPPLVIQEAELETVVETVREVLVDRDWRLENGD